MELSTTNIIRFLAELGNLTRETGIKLEGSGLFVAEITSDESGYAVGSGGEVVWVDPSDEFDWDNYAKLIIK